MKARKEPRIEIVKNGSGVPCYVFRWYEVLPDGGERRRKREIGKVGSVTFEQAEEIVAGWEAAAINDIIGTRPIQTVGELIQHFRGKEMVDKGADGRAWSTRDRYEYYLNTWVEPRWGKVRLDAIVAGPVEDWLRQLKRKPRKGENIPEAVLDKNGLIAVAPGTKEKIRDLMSVLYNHAIRWGICKTNPISGPGRKSGVRQGGKRQKTPDILEIGEMRSILAELAIRERALISLVMISGLRRSELAGLQWSDIDFENLIINVVRSVVDQVTGRCKTEASRKPVPIDSFTAADLLAWYRLTPYREPDDWVFASDSASLGDRRGKQPLWLSRVMQHHIQPVVKRLGISKRVSWHTFRHTFTSLLIVHERNVKVVQELLRHATSKTTLDKYAQAQMADKRRAQMRIVNDLRRPEGAKLVARRASPRRMRMLSRRKA